MGGLLESFWAHQQVVTRQSGYHGPAFPATRGTAQGGLVSPKLFNVVVNTVIWGHRTPGFPLEGGSGAHRHLSKIQSPVP